MQTNARRYRITYAITGETREYSHAKAMRVLNHIDIRIENEERIALGELELGSTFVDRDGDTWERIA